MIHSFCKQSSSVRPLASPLPSTPSAPNLSGVQLYFYQDKITFSDGTSETINVPGVTDGTGSVDFVGFTDPGKSISSVTITSGAGGYGDYIGIDDVSYNLPGTVTPEPSTEVLMLTGCLALGLLMWKRRAAQVF